jgi:hypothetical protein
MPIMAKKKSDNDRHKPREMVGIPKTLAAALRKWGEADCFNLTDVVKMACIEFAKSRGFWPPPDKRAPQS